MFSSVTKQTKVSSVQETAKCSPIGSVFKAEILIHTTPSPPQQSGYRKGGFKFIFVTIVTDQGVF